MDGIPEGTVRIVLPVERVGDEVEALCGGRVIEGERELGMYGMVS